jgi:hypothetical protein
MGIFIKNNTKRVQKDDTKQTVLTNTATNKSLIGEEVVVAEKKAIKKGFGDKKIVNKEPVKATINSVAVGKEEKKSVLLFENNEKNEPTTNSLINKINKSSGRNSIFDKVVAPEIKNSNVAKSNDKVVNDIYDKARKNISFIKNKNNKYYDFVFTKGYINEKDIKHVNTELDKQLNNLKINPSTMDLYFFKSFIKDKTIALIANSSDLLNKKLGAEIDSHDIVVRFNSYKILKEDTGEKLTIHVSIYLQNENLNNFAPIRFILSGNKINWAKKILTLNKFNQSTILKYNHHSTLPGNFRDDSPTTTGFATLILLLKIGGFQKINMFGFDFYQNGNDSLFRTDVGMESPISTVHDYFFEKEFMMEYSYEYDDKKNIITFYDYSTF